MKFAPNQKQRQLKRIIGAFLAAVFVFNVIPPAAAADTYYYGVAGKTLFPCTYNYMPMMVGDELMCPVQLLIDGLGFNYRNAPDEGNYTLYKDGRFLIFYLNRPGSYDINWPYEDKSLLKLNGTYYVPLQHVAERFGFALSPPISTSYGTVIRISLIGETMSDQDLQKSISNQLSRAQESYKIINGIAPPPQPKPAPIVYLGFDADGESDVSGVLDVLDKQGISATFFVTPEFADSSGVRSIIVRGHTLGIRLDSSDSLDELAYTNQALRFSALTQTRILRLAGEVNDETRDALESSGYRLWEWKLDWENSNLYKSIDSAKNACYVRFGCDEASVDALVKLLNQLKSLNAEYFAVNEAQPPVRS